MVEEKPKVGILGLILSFLFPIVGVILFIFRKEKVVNPLAYLIAATLGFGINVIVALLMGAL